MAHELCVKTAPAVSGPFFWRFCTPLSEAHMVVGSWTLALWGPRECSVSPRLPPTVLAPSLPYLGGMGSPRGMLAPTLWCTTTARKRLNGRFWGHCVGVAGGAPRRVGAMASSGGGPSRVINHPGQHRFWWNGGGGTRARGQGPTLLSSETPQTSSCGEAGAREISGVCRPFRDPSCLPRLPNMLN